jgi:hypothetical protein
LTQLKGTQIFFKGCKLGLHLTPGSGATVFLGQFDQNGQVFQSLSEILEREKDALDLLGACAYLSSTIRIIPEAGTRLLVFEFSEFA